MKAKVSFICLILAAAFLVLAAPGADASTLVTQTALPGACVPQFQVPLPVFGPAGPIQRVDASKHPYLTVTMKEIDQVVLPQTTFPCPDLGVGVTVTPGKTRVWAYKTSDTLTGKLLAPPNWPAVTISARRYIPTQVKYVNALPTFDAGNPTGPGLVQGLITVDQTIDWSDPLGNAAANNCTMFPQVLPLAAACLTPYVGPAPAVAHLHGGEVASQSDGGPLGWFTPNGLTGRLYSTFYNAGPGTQVDFYPNDQEPGTLWFHDHTMGQTRTNVYSGLEAFYFLRDPQNEPKNLPGGPYEIEMAIQDRQFDTTGQLFFPDGSGADAATSNLNGTPPNTDNTAGSPGMHPFWIPEFIGDVVVVNGAPWPYFNVEPRRYRLRLLDGSNARAYNLTFGSAPAYVIGADDNYLDSPVAVSSILMLPGQRRDVIVDFSGLAGQTVTVTNDAPVPYPSGLSPVPYVDPTNPLCDPVTHICPADQPQMANVMQFVVSGTPVADASCNPAAGGCKRRTPMVRLTDGAGLIVNGVKIDKVRRMTLKEFEGSPYNASPGGPLMVLVNNTQFMGSASPSIASIFTKDGISERPRQGSTELWEIVNLTVDAHPMHTHLVQFQVLNREPFDAAGYQALWESSFPADTGYSPLCTGGVFCPGYGPPLPYNTAVRDEIFPGYPAIIGGNPSIAPYLSGVAVPPAADEAGWLDTARANPGEVLRILIRFAPTDVPVVPNISFKGFNFYSFDPTKGPGYVWHCHIVDHEDQDMMRPYRVVK